MELTDKDIRDALVLVIEKGPDMPRSMCTRACQYLGVNRYGDAEGDRSHEFLRIRDIRDQMVEDGEIFYKPGGTDPFMADSCHLNVDFPGRICGRNSISTPTLISESC